MKEILDQPERTEPSADKPAHKGSHKPQKSGHIKGHPEVPASDHRLHGSYGAGTQSAGAGVAVQSGYAEILQFSLINLSLREPHQIAVGKKSPKDLDSVSSHSFVFLFIIQFRYTPYRFLQPYQKPRTFLLWKYHRASLPHPKAPQIFPLWEFCHCSAPTGRVFSSSSFQFLSAVISAPVFPGGSSIHL